MVSRLIFPLPGFIFLVSLALQGCAPTSINSNDDSAPGLTRTSMINPGENGVQSGSSLEAMRRGQLAESGPLKDVFYDFDHYNLRLEARETLKRNAEWLKANPSVRVEIEGHADERGTSEYNLALGAKRAHTSKDYLISLGISGNRLNTVSYGEEVSVCAEHSEECWQKNRRARFAVIAPRPAL